MSNTAWYQGLRPYKGMTPDRPRVGYYPAKVRTTALSIGTPMCLNATGQVTPLSITTAASQVNILGVLAEFHKSGVTAGRMIGIWDDPSQLYMIRCHATAVTGQTSVGQNIRMCYVTANNTNQSPNVSAAHNTTTGFSKVRGRTLASSISALKIVGISREVGHDATSYCDVIVKINDGAHFSSRVTGI